MSFSFDLRVVYLWWVKLLLMIFSELNVLLEKLNL